MKSIFVLFICMFISSFSVKAQWSQLADYPGWFTQSTFDFSIGNYGYIGGSTAYCYDSYKYDPSIDTWTQLNNVPFGLSAPFSEVYNGKAYVGIGYKDISMSMELWEYTPSTDNWVTLANCPAIPTTTNGYYDGSNEQSFVLDDNIYIILPKSEEPTPGNRVYITELWMYNITTNSWIQKNNLNFGYISADLAFSVNETAYLIGSDSRSSLPNDSVYVYDKINDLWSAIPNVIAPYNYSLGTGFVIGNNIYVGMALGTGCCDKFYQFNTINDTWTRLQDVLDPYAHDEAASFVVDGVGYMGLGDNNQNPPTNRFFAKYIPLTTSIDYKNTLNNRFVLFPNPSNGLFSIASDKNITYVKVYSLTGKLIKTINNNFSNIDLRHLVKGVYFIKILTNINSLTKIIIIK